MSRFISLMVGALVALWCLPALADDEDWYKGCQQDSTSAITSGVGLGAFVCATFGDSDTLNGETKMLSVSSCDNYDVLVFPDRDGTADDVVTFNVYACGLPTDASGDSPPDAGWSATGLCWIVENLTLDGVPATNTEAIYGAAAEWIYVFAIGIDEQGPDDPLIQVRCNPPKL